MSTIANPTAAQRLDTILEAIAAGDTVSPADLANARAEAAAADDIATLSVQGSRAREKAARALDKRQADAKVAARNDLPELPADELAEAVAAARAAIDHVADVRTAHAVRIQGVKAVLTAGGVVEMPPLGGDHAGIDYDNHGHQHVSAVTIDGNTYSADAITQAIVDVAKYACRVSGTGRSVS